MYYNKTVIGLPVRIERDFIQAQIKTAWFNEKVDEEIYVGQPKKIHPKENM